MFKVILIAIAAFYFVVPAQAHAITLPQLWVADGYREVTAVNSGSVSYLPVKVDNFDSLARCEAYIDEQNAMFVGQNIKNYAGKQRIVATCSQQR